jgi:peptide/nickel transport system substrate-binding protein
VPKGLPSYTENLKGYNYQPELARKLLADAGFPSGKNFPKISLYTNSDYADICSFLAKEWEQIGIQVSIETMESGILREQMAKGDIAFFRASWIADYPDAESFLTCFYSKNPAPPNYTRFRVPAFDAAYEDALREEDAIKRMAIYRQADSLLIAEAPVIFLYYDEIARFSNPKLRGLSKNGMNLVGFKKVEKKLEDN